MTEIKKCTCESKYQDERYGEYNRVFNYAEQAAPGKQPGWRCTVCGKVVSK